MWGARRDDEVRPRLVHRDIRPVERRSASEEREGPDGVSERVFRFASCGPRDAPADAHAEEWNGDAEERAARVVAGHEAAQSEDRPADAPLRDDRALVGAVERPD